MLKGMLPVSHTTSISLTNNEKQQIYSETKKGNLIVNIKKAIDDNIQFLTVTVLTPEDLNTLKKQQSEFEDIWHSTGPAIVSIYAEKKDNTGSGNEIDSAFVSWNTSMDRGAWAAIKQKLSDRGISLSNFSNGTEFTQTVTSYIDDKIKNPKANGTDPQYLYRAFADSVWSVDIKPAWIPYLLNNKLLTTTDDNKIEAKIAEWKNSVNQANYTWLYIILGIIAVIIIVFLFKASSSRSKIKPGKSMI